jgi:hypothetical protein
MTTATPSRRKHRLPMSAPMIKAIELELAQPGAGKTQTRRIVKPQPEMWQHATDNCDIEELPGWMAPGGRFLEPLHYKDWLSEMARHAPYGQPGDLIAFTETFAFGPGYDGLPPRSVPAEPYVQVWYQADAAAAAARGRWRPAMFMPYWASRYTGVVTGVRVERVQEIGEKDAVAEGIERVGGEASVCPWRNYLKGKPGEMGLHCSAPSRSFQTLWDSINAKTHPWDSNPWVWVYSFRPIAANVLAVESDLAAFGLEAAA